MYDSEYVWIEKLIKNIPLGSLLGQWVHNDTEVTIWPNCLSV